MPNKADTSPEAIRSTLQKLIINFEEELKSPELREKVLALIPVFRALRKLGKTLIPQEMTSSARDKIIFYFKKYPYTIIHGDEFLVISGIQEYARRIRELRVQFGWSIASGKTVKEMSEQGDFPLEEDILKAKPDSYVLLSEQQDKEAAFRWAVANEIRRKKENVRSKLLEYFKKNVNKSVSGEELRYVANDKTEWARRVRELRTEFGWPITTKNTGRPDLAVGAYVLESLRQSPEHDRKIPDPLRTAVMRRDSYRCKQCTWSHKEWNPSDPRHLELHHVRQHAKGGQNTEVNLITLCTICHDEVHRKK